MLHFAIPLTNWSRGKKHCKSGKSQGKNTLKNNAHHEKLNCQKTDYLNIEMMSKARSVFNEI